MSDELTIVSVNVSKPKVLLRWPGGDVISAIDKQPVDAGHLDLTQLNLDGDEQADTRPTPGGGQVHGGPHAAVYAFPSEHFPRISELIGGVVGPGFMGENVTTRGVDEDDACIGDVWRWGEALLQISAPRGPCYKLGIRMGQQALRTAIREETLVGWYLRVLAPERVPATGRIVVEERHPARVSVAEVQRAINDRHTTTPTWPNSHRSRPPWHGSYACAIATSSAAYPNATRGTPSHTTGSGSDVIGGSLRADHTP